MHSPFLLLSLAVCLAVSTKVTVDKKVVPVKEEVVPDSPSQQARFDHYVVLKVIPETEDKVKSLLEMIANQPDLDIWKRTDAVNEQAHIFVSPKKRAEVEDFLDKTGIKHEVLIPNVQEILDQTMRARTVEFDWNNYHRIDVINAWLARLAAEYPNVATLVNGGRSVEGRRIQGIRIAHKANLPVFFLEGGIHAREWISPATATYILNSLLTSTDPLIQQLARSYEWHIFPSVNPDGYEFSHTNNRFWRKNRARITINCFGTDLNRNWGIAWGVAGVNLDPCSESYPGPKAESELETQTRRLYMEPLLDRMRVFLALHSYSQLLLMPWGFTNNLSPNHTELMRVGQKAVNAMFSRHHTRFQGGPLALKLYAASGNSMDWTHANGVPFSYTIELRDTGAWGFLLPADQILPAAEETLDGVLTIAREALARI